jgi:hypothetical protein
MRRNTPPLPPLFRMYQVLPESPPPQFFCRISGFLTVHFYFMLSTYVSSSFVHPPFSTSSIYLLPSLSVFLVHLYEIFIIFFSDYFAFISFLIPSQIWNIVKSVVCVCVCVCVCARVCLYVSASHTVETATRHLFLMLSSSLLRSLSSLSLSIFSASRGEGHIGCNVCICSVLSVVWIPCGVNHSSRCPRLLLI